MKRNLSPGSVDRNRPKSMKGTRIESSRAALMLGVFLLGIFLTGARATELETKNTIYSPFGKRDPFRPLANKKGRDLSSLSPLERYSVEQYRLRAILSSITKPTAMFSDPAGKSHLLSEGDILGKEKAIVSRILSSEVILTQKTTNYLGNESLVEKVVSLPEEDMLLRDAVARPFAPGTPPPMEMTRKATPPNGTNALSPERDPMGAPTPTATVPDQTAADPNTGAANPAAAPTSPAAPIPGPADGGPTAHPTIEPFPVGQ